jgi:hypothetical protein
MRIADFGFGDLAEFVRSQKAEIRNPNSQILVSSLYGV